MPKFVSLSLENKLSVNDVKNNLSITDEILLSLESIFNNISISNLFGLDEVVRDSVINYGVFDINSIDFDKVNLNDMEMKIFNVISLFEPRVDKKSLLVGCEREVNDLIKANITFYVASDKGQMINVTLKVSKIMRTIRCYNSI